MRLLTLGLYDPTDPSEGPVWHTGVFVDGPKIQQRLRTVVDVYNRFHTGDEMAAAVFVLAEVAIGPGFDSADPEGTCQALKAFGETLNLADPIHD